MSETVSGHEALVHAAVQAIAKATAAQLHHGSRIPEKLIAERGLLVVGAEHDLATGRVEYFGGGEA